MSIAFFDVDGTLLAKPSLERRFFRTLRWQGKIPVANYLGWITEAIRLGLPIRDLRVLGALVVLTVAFTYLSTLNLAWPGQTRPEDVSSAVYDSLGRVVRAGVRFNY